jgi:hypothetical protein
VLRIHVDKYSKYSLHPSTFVYVHYVSEATRMTLIPHSILRYFNQ